jgi:hypothetical protein
LCDRAAREIPRSGQPGSNTHNLQFNIKCNVLTLNQSIPDNIIIRHETRDNRLNQQKCVHFLRKRLFLSVQTGKIRPRQRQGMARTEADKLKWNKKQKTAWPPRPQREKGKAQQSRDLKTSPSCLRQSTSPCQGRCRGIRRGGEVFKSGALRATYQHRKRHLLKQALKQFALVPSGCMRNPALRGLPCHGRL